MKKILFTGGGSAGHVTPNIALIEAIVKSGEADVCYMGTGGVEKRLIEPIKIPYYTFDCPKLVRSFSLKNLGIPAAFSRAVKEAKKGLETFRPDVVFSKGGYVSLPVVVAAHKLSIPCLTHESDLSAGLANKLMARKCRHVLTSFPETADKFKNGKFTGSPIRCNVLSGDKSTAKAHYGFDKKSGRKTLLVFGGGSGSQRLNEILRSHLSALSEKYDILHLCGSGNAVHAKFRGYKQIEFETDMGTAYAAADLVISRAGSNTVFELLALKKPALLVPLEGQTRGDQIENARYFEKKGLIRILSQKDGAYLPEAIEDALNDETLKDNLAVSDFSSGTKNILAEIRALL
ncbi:MAG: UDP-N-acetylglucosamine--N-acetylmuramyl-(pentapeptide) pyrophosphoryl-undecaprenol N-acetylglucosamine transferase [Clostridia bacterium]|nr:UDP-N-acetylglucosamine--N-acetylmuramyl-(pentapeptide) pyrophosphoryl-undecaprenol N-acetylglucosamine transferase [Clostridia bacterium]